MILYRTKALKSFNLLVRKNNEENNSVEMYYGKEMINKHIISKLTINENKFYVFDTTAEMWEYYLKLDVKNHYEIILDSNKDRNNMQKIKFDLDAEIEKLQQINIIELGDAFEINKQKCNVIGIIDINTIKMYTLLDILIEQIIYTFKALYTDFEITRKDIIIFDSSGMKNGKYKYSYHILIYTFGVLFAGECKIFTSNVIQNLSDGLKSLIDTSINSRNHAFRLYLSTKENSDRVKQLNQQLNEYFGVFNEEIDITNPYYQDLVSIRSENVQQLPCILQSTNTYIAVGITTEIETKVLEIFNDQDYSNCFSYTGRNGNRFTFRRKRSCMCPVHGKIHDSENMHLFITPDKNKLCIFYYCYRPVDVGEIKCIKIGEIDQKNADTILEKVEDDNFLIRHIEDINTGKVNLEKLFSTKFERVPDTLIYNEPLVRPYELHNTLIVQCQMKMGKTKALREYINKYFKDGVTKPYVIRFLSSRLTFSNSIIKDFNEFELYTDIVDNDIFAQKYPKVIIQVESLHRLSPYDDVDLLIIDEVESVFDQFNSPYITNISGTFAIFEKLMRDTEFVVMMDANISNRTYNLIANMRNKYPVHFHYNKFLRAKEDKYYFTNSISTWYNSLELAISQKKRIVIPTNSKSTAEQCNKLITEYAKSKNIDVKIQMYTSETSQSVKYKHFKDVKSHWKQYDILIYTPTLSAGVSFEEEHFDVLFGYFIDKSCNVETCRQMLGRVRNLKLQEHYICIKGQQKYLPTDINHIKSLFYSRKAHLLGRDNANTPMFYEYDKNGEKQYYENPYAKMWFENTRMNNISQNTFIFRFIDQVAYSGAEISILKHYDIDSNKYGYFASHISDANEAIIAEKSKNIAEAPTITKEQHKEIEDKIRFQQEVTQDEQYSCEKYWFVETYKWSPEVNITPEFVQEYNKQEVKTVFKNLSKISQRTTIEESLELMREKEADLHKKIEMSEDPKYEMMELQQHRPYGYIYHSLAYKLLRDSGMMINKMNYVYYPDLYNRYIILGSYLEKEKLLLQNIIDKKYDIKTLYTDLIKFDDKIPIVAPEARLNAEKYIKYILNIINPFLGRMYGVKIIKGANKGKYCRDGFYYLEETDIGKKFIKTKHIPQIVLINQKEKTIEDYRVIDKFYYDYIYSDEYKQQHPYISDD